MVIRVCGIRAWFGNVTTVWNEVRYQEAPQTEAVQETGQTSAWTSERMRRHDNAQIIMVGDLERPLPDVEARQARAGLLCGSARRGRLCRNAPILLLLLLLRSPPARFCASCMHPSCAVETRSS